VFFFRKAGETADPHRKREKGVIISIEVYNKAGEGKLEKPGTDQKIKKVGEKRKLMQERFTDRPAEAL